MASPRAENTATLLSNGEVLVAGGTGNISVLGSAPYNSAELYDPSAGTWTSAGHMSQFRFSHTATLLANGSVLVAGGEPGGSGPTAAPVNSTEIFDPVGGTWTPIGSMTVARSRHSATLLPNGKLLVAGGYNQNGGGLVLASAEIYDPVAATWTLTGSMSVARELQSATLLPNGKVLVAGGLDAVGTSASAEIYDPVAATWTLTGSMSAARQGPSATLLANGTVLVAGGGPANAEIYDPAAGTWSLAGSLSAANTGGTITTLLSDGTVLAVGALPPAPPATTPWVGAEIYY
jgi:N-acetylneuraminic acid mutarotase